jgi:hypothetical protein
MRAFQNQRKSMELLEGVTWLVEKANVLGCIFFLGSNCIGLPFETLWQLSPQVPHKKKDL